MVGTCEQRTVLLGIIFIEKVAQILPVRLLRRQYFAPHDFLATRQVSRKGIVIIAVVFPHYRAFSPAKRVIGGRIEPGQVMDNSCWLPVGVELDNPVIGLPVFYHKVPLVVIINEN